MLYLNQGLSTKGVTLKMSEVDQTEPYQLKNGCPICSSLPEKWKVRDRGLYEVDKMQCQVCGSKLDVDGTRVYLVSKGSGVIDLNN